MTFIPKNTGHYTDRFKTPTAHITVKKQRIKQFENSVYLKDGDEFEIELFNSTNTTILSKIKINGNFISQTGIIIKPGQRVFLERYIDVDKKFAFSTYEINGKNKEVLDAIQDNGLVEVYFYREDLNKFFNNIILNSTNTSSVPYSTLTNTLGTITTTSSQPYWQLIGNNVNYSSNTLTNSDFLSMTTPNTNLRSKKSLTETGRVEQGDKSDQKLTYTNNYTFEHMTFHKVIWKIHPHSTKPIEVTELKKYCHNCGTKIKKSTYKFCPNCGTKLD